MFTVSDFYNIGLLRNVEILTGASGFSRAVRNVGVLDYEYISAKIQEKFLPDDVVLSSFLSLRDRPDLAVDAIRALIDIGVSCLGIKKIYLTELPPELIAYAMEKDFSIFLFEEEISFESIIIAAFDNLKNQEEEGPEEQRARKLAEWSGHPEEIRKIAQEINPEFYENAAVLAFRGSRRFLAEELALIRQTLRQKEREQRMVWDVCGYQSGAVLFLTVPDKPDRERTLEMELARVCTEQLGDVRVGISDPLDDLGELGVALWEAVYALEYAQFTGQPISFFREMRHYRLILPMSETPWGKRYCSRVLRSLLQCPRCDRKKNEALLHTLTVYIHCGKNVRRTAEELGQHENTVRYRIRRVCQLLDMEENDESQWMELSIAVYLYETIIRLEQSRSE